MPETLTEFDIFLVHPQFKKVLIWRDCFKIYGDVQGDLANRWKEGFVIDGATLPSFSSAEQQCFIIDWQRSTVDVEVELIFNKFHLRNCAKRVILQEPCHKREQFT